MNFSWGTGDSIGLASSDSSYETRAYIHWLGSGSLGTPTAIRLIAAVQDSNDPGDVRIQDTTNGNTIAVVIGFTVTAPTIIDMGALSNVSAGQAIWTVDMRVPSNAVFVFALRVVF